MNIMYTKDIVVLIRIVFTKVDIISNSINNNNGGTRLIFTNYKISMD